MLIVLKIPESVILEVILLAATKFFRMFVALPMLVLVFTAQLSTSQSQGQVE